MEKKIYPYLIEEQKIRSYYEFLLNNKFKLKYFDKKKDLETYKFFLPEIRNLMFWTYNLTLSKIKGVNKEEFNNMNDELKATVCGNYYCNIFEKNKIMLVCFNNGICFAITEDEKEANKVKKFKNKVEMQEFNLRDEDAYGVPTELKDNTTKDEFPVMYLYILQLYKMIFLNKVQKEIQNPSKFDKVRNDFVRFVEQIYNIRATDNREATELITKWEEELELDKYYIRVDNEFDLLYKNNKLNENNVFSKITIIICIVAIIVGIINLWGML